MRKYIYTLIGIAAALSAFSCSQVLEEDINTTEDPQTQPVKEYVLAGNIPATITADLVQTKTNYDSDGKFSWKVSDEVQLYFVDDIDTPANQGWVAYYIADAGAIVGKKATFTIKAGQEGKTDAEFGALKDYKNTGLAVYGRGADNTIARPYSANTESCSDLGGKFISLRQKLTGDASEVILLGTESEGVFSFRTAAAVLKVTVTGIPANASKLKLCTANNESSPLDGDFLFDDTRELQKGDYYNSSHEYVYVDLSGESAIDSRDFYFNIPTGSYDANTISLVLEDGSGNELLKKTITSAFTFNRNDLVSVSFANEWVTLGTGKFIDNFLWAKIVAKGLDKDVPDYVNVTIQQNVSDPNTFRLVDPYGAAATQFGYSSSNTSNRDDYLEFTVEGSTTGSSVTGFTTHITGFAIDGSNYNPELVYPTTYSAESSTAQNKVLVGNASLPEIVQFAPAYHYNGYAMTSSYTYTQAFDKKGVFRIMFPGVSGYEGSLTVNASATSNTLSPLAWTHEASAARIRMVISQYTDYQIAAPQVNSYYCGNYPSGNDAANDVSNTSWNASSKVTAAAMSSGPVYLSWYTTDSGETVIYSQGRTKVYYISSADVTALCKQHTSTGYKNYLQSDALSGSYTFEVSESPLTSNIKMTEFDGMTPDMTSLEDTHNIYTSLYWIAPGTTKYTGADPEFGAGTAQYGIYDSSTGSISLDATKPFFTRGLVNVYVYSYSDYAGSGRGTANTPGTFNFTVSAGAVNVADTYINARFDGNDKASAPYSNTVTEVVD